jgi:hypothetical protein
MLHCFFQSLCHNANSEIMASDWDACLPDWERCDKKSVWLFRKEIADLAVNSV